MHTKGQHISLPPSWETWIEFPVSSFSPAHSQVLSVFGEWTGRWEWSSSPSSPSQSKKARKLTEKERNLSIPIILWEGQKSQCMFYYYVYNVHSSADKYVINFYKQFFTKWQCIAFLNNNRCEKCHPAERSDLDKYTTHLLLSLCHVWFILLIPTLCIFSIKHEYHTVTSKGKALVIVKF